MVPTLEVGQRVLVNRASYHFGDPGIGDIVVFKAPNGAVGKGPECGVRRDFGRQACPRPVEGQSDTNFIKRVVAVPGDTLSIRRGHPVVNGVMAEEDFIKGCPKAEICNLEEEITIPDDHYFMMGDNRGGSDDSRYWGPIPRDWIIGKAFSTYWPPDRIGLF